MRKPTPKGIRVLKKMVDNDYYLLHSIHGMKGHYFFVTRQFKQIGDVFNQDKLLSGDHGRIYDFLTPIVPKDKAKKDKLMPGWGDSLLKVNAAGRELVEKHRAAIEKKEAAEKERIEKTRRLVIFRTSSYRRHRILGVEQQAVDLMEVTKVTDKRYQGKIIATCHQYSNGIEREKSERQVSIDKELVVMDPATYEQYEAFVKVEQQLIADLKEKASQQAKEIAEINRRYTERAEQNAAMAADMLREAGIPKEVVDRYHEYHKEQTAARKELHARLDELDDDLD